MRILLVEDDAMNVDLFQTALEQDGHAVAVEHDGVSGETRALAEQFDLILLDIQLPRRTGLEVCQSLRSSGLQTPIVALSASVLREEIDRTIEAGFTQFLSKPISPKTLRTAVRAYVTKGSDVVA